MRKKRSATNGWRSTTLLSEHSGMFSSCNNIENDRHLERHCAHEQSI